MDRDCFCLSKRAWRNPKYWRNLGRRSLL